MVSDAADADYELGGERRRGQLPARVPGLACIRIAEEGKAFEVLNLGERQFASVWRAVSGRSGRCGGAQPPKTLRSRRLPVATGSARIFFSSSAIMKNRPSSARAVTCFCTLVSSPLSSPSEPALPATAL